MSDQFFEVMHFRVGVEETFGLNQKETPAEATVKVLVNGSLEHRVAEGNGPVHAFDTALRKALSPYYPEIERIKITDFWVRIHKDDQGTGSKVEVLMIFFLDNEREWAIRETSTNIIKASAQALIRGFREILTFTIEQALVNVA